jgi:hypothetical protein
MKWYFQDRPAIAGAGQDDGYTPPGLISLPEELLERHGARVLDPGKAAVMSGDPTLRPTVYLARTLLVPEYLLQNQAFIDATDLALSAVGMKLTMLAADPDLVEGGGEIIEELRRLPRIAVLGPREDSRVPVVVDAWVALQALRAAAALPDHPLEKAAVQHVELEYVNLGASLTGAPIGNGGGGIAGGTQGGDVSGPSPTDSYLFSGSDPRIPVAVLLDAPKFKSEPECQTEYGGRPVIAVLDTGLGPHQWLKTADSTIFADGPVVGDSAIQDAIRDEGEKAVTAGAGPRRVIKDVWDEPMTANPLLGELNPAFGHGTFIAGIVRQVAPDARILALRVMGADDIAYQGDVICALRELAKRIALHRDDDVAAAVQVVSLSFGHFSELPRIKASESGLWRAIKVLLRLGVIVVAAAGNYATTRKFYPAAFATETVPPDEVPVISVGALNPNGTKAMFSNDGDWVKAFAQGAAVLSIYPINVNASRAPELEMPPGPTPLGAPSKRATLKLDDFGDGFALWSGTSFSAPYVAALILRSLQKGATQKSDLRLDLPGGPGGGDPDKALAMKKQRAVAAVANLRQQGHQDG